VGEAPPGGRGLSAPAGKPPQVLVRLRRRRRRRRLRLRPVLVSVLRAPKARAGTIWLKLATALTSLL